MKHTVPYIQDMSTELREVLAQYPEQAELHGVMIMYSVANVLQQAFTEAQLQNVMQQVNELLGKPKLNVNSVVKFLDYTPYPGAVPTDRTMVVETLGTLVGYYVHTSNITDAVCKSIPAYTYEQGAVNAEKSGPFAGMVPATRVQIEFTYEQTRVVMTNLNCTDGTFRIHSIQPL